MSELTANLKSRFFRLYAKGLFPLPIVFFLDSFNSLNIETDEKDIIMNGMMLPISKYRAPNMLTKGILFKSHIRSSELFWYNGTRLSNTNISENKSILTIAKTAIIPI